MSLFTGLQKLPPPVCATCGDCFCQCGRPDCQLRPGRVPGSTALHHVECCFFLAQADRLIRYAGGHVDEALKQ